LAKKQIYFDAWAQESEVDLALMALRLLDESIIVREAGVGLHTASEV